MTDSGMSRLTVSILSLSPLALTGESSTIGVPTPDLAELIDITLWTFSGGRDLPGARGGIGGGVFCIV
jgi:hypothetical protein